MSSDKHCCVAGCGESGDMHKVLHGFPNPEKDKKRFNEWLYAIGNNILGLENKRIYKYRRVCHSHFKDEYLSRNNKISNVAVPTLRMQAPLSLKSSSGNRKPMKTIMNLTNPSTSSDKGILPAECKETADFVIFMDNIFDSVNGSYMKNKKAKPLLGPASPSSVHHKTWEEGITMFQSMVFETSAGKREIVPTVTNWMWTLKGINILLKKLKDDFNVTSVWLRHLNQDQLENFFGAVRSHGCRNTNPTSDQFESAFATLLINNLNSAHNRGKNCEMIYTLTLIRDHFEHDNFSVMCTRIN